MTIGSARRKFEVEAELVALMSELAKYLIEAGISNKRFSSIGRLAYFLAASHDAKFRNEKLNQSAVAAMTGLTRVQVRQFAKQNHPKPVRTVDRLEIVIEGWSSDPSFSDGPSLPRALRATGRGKNFSALAKKYGGDLPARALLREMQRHNLVTHRDGCVSLKPNVTKSRAEQRLQFFARAMSNLIKSSSTEVTSSGHMRSLTLEVDYPAPTDKGRLLVYKRAEEGLRNYLTGLQAVGSALAEAPTKKKSARKVTRARVVLVSEEFESKK